MIADEVLLLAGLLTAGYAISHTVAGRLTRRFPPLGERIEVDGVAMHYLDRPPRPEGHAPADHLPVVFIHGASGNLRDPYLAFGERLDGRRLIFVDRPGHGHSERGGAASASPIRQAALVKGVLDRLGVGRAIIVGHSLGASITAAFAISFPEATAGLVFVAPASHPWGGELPWQHRVMRLPLVGALFAHVLALPIGFALIGKAVRETFAPDPVPADYMRRIGGYLTLRPDSFRANGRDVIELHDHISAMAPRYTAITAPTTIVTGDSDPVVYAHIHSRGLHRDIAGSKLIVLPGIGHMPHHAATDTVIEAIEDVAARAALA